MGIHYNQASGTFHLQAHRTSYIMQVVKSGHLAHRYWGKKIRSVTPSNELRFHGRAFSPSPDPNDGGFSLDTLPQEYPAYGTSDFRQPAFQVQYDDGSTITDLRYAGHRIFRGKPRLSGLPATYVENDLEAETLEIDTIDSVIGLKVVLSYTVYEQLDVITRSVRFIHEGNQPVKLLRALSMSLDFDHSKFDLLHLSGAWARALRGTTHACLRQSSD